MSKKANGGLKPYKAYLFRDKDPVIDELRTLIEDAFGKRVNVKNLHDIEISGGPSTSCMTAWFFGKTRRPQSASIEAAGRAIGYRRGWQRIEK
jgi:hypothetical protein